MHFKPFNPDKELKKTNRKYTKKQLIITLLVLVVMITIGSSYAIFSIQPEYHTFIKSQVGEFSTGDIKLSVLVEGVAQSEFPAKGTGYAYEKVECKNGSTGTWDANTWQLTLTSQGPDKCTVSFEEVKIIITSATVHQDDIGGFKLKMIEINPQNEISEYYIRVNGTETFYQINFNETIYLNEADDCILNDIDIYIKDIEGNKSNIYTIKSTWEGHPAICK